MKQKVLALFFAFLSFFLFSCSEQEMTCFTLELGKEYVVGLKINDYETKGILTKEEDGISFLHGNSTSPLYGMREKFSEEGYESLFHGMEWESTEVKMQGSVLWEAIIFAENNKTWSVKSDTLNGIDTEQRSFTDREKSIDVFFSRETGEILRLSGIMGTDSFEINFAK